MSGLKNRIDEVRQRNRLQHREFARQVREHMDKAPSLSTVHGYVAGDTEKIPASFVAAVCVGFGVNPRWLLWDEGPYELRGPSVPEVRLQVIGQIADGKLDEDALKKILEMGEENPTRPPEAPVGGSLAAKNASRSGGDARKQEGGNGN